MTAESNEKDRSITPWRTVLEQHIEDLHAPGACSCGWELWDGTVDECRAAYRDHVNAYLCETLERADLLSQRVQALLETERAERRARVIPPGGPDA